MKFIIANITKLLIYLKFCMINCKEWLKREKRKKEKETHFVFFLTHARDPNPLPPPPVSFTVAAGASPLFRRSVKPSCRALPSDRLPSLRLLDGRRRLPGFLAFRYPSSEPGKIWLVWLKFLVGLGHPWFGFKIVLLLALEGWIIAFGRK